MDSSIDYGMEDDAYNDDSQESEQQTQSTQQASQPQMVSVDAHLWGYMQPCSASLTRIDFWKIHPKYTIGRNTELNQVILPGFKVSESNHAYIPLVEDLIICTATVRQSTLYHQLGWRTKC
jgi:serine/threonine/tyrosine protein kinase RAD53